jgi:uroporphyrinogen-III synthase/AcrR family transcriptional regulator
VNARGEARIASIFEAAAALFGAHAPEHVTMEEIATKASVSKGTLYNYFVSKEDLFRELLSFRFDELAEALEGEGCDSRDRTTRLRRMVESLFRFQLAHADWFRMRRQAEGLANSRGVLREKEARIEQALQTAIEDKSLPGRDPARDAHLILGTVDAAVARCLENGLEGGDCDPESDELWHFVRGAVGRESAAAEEAPLGGRTVLVTREEGSDGPLSSALRGRGARVVAVPLLETRPPRDPNALEREARRLDTYDWVFLTSARAARALFELAPPNGRHPRLAVVGRGTARSARESGWEPDLVGHSGAVALVKELRRTEALLEEASILFPAAEKARAEGLESLRETGADVRVVTAYRTVPCAHAVKELRRVLTAEKIDAITFASPSAVDVFTEAIRGLAEWGAPRLAAIGPTTSEALKAKGFPEVIVASEPGFEALARALAEDFVKER